MRLATRPAYPLPSAEEFPTHDRSIRYPDVIQCTAAHGWSDIAHDDPVDLPPSALDLTMPRAEIFARD